jgi:hypothetical protein
MVMRKLLYIEDNEDNLYMLQLRFSAGTRSSAQGMARLGARWRPANDPI